MVLIIAALQLTSPYGGSSNVAALAHKKVSGLQSQSVLVLLGKIHLVQFRQVESAPQNVPRPQKWSLVFADSVLLGDLLSLLNREERIEPLDLPIDWEFSEFS